MIDRAPSLVRLRTIWKLFFAYDVDTGAGRFARMSVRTLAAWSIFARRMRFEHG